MNRLNLSDSDDSEFDDDELDAGLYDPRLDHRPSDRTDDDRFAGDGSLLGLAPGADDGIDRAAIEALVAKLDPGDDLHRACRSICAALFDGTQDPAELQAAVTAEMKKRFS
ncbi:MAG: hypothetical protein K8U03_16710 [Planctomycetia bacterium]|nr:hypothetical protein [Planctomycetia bacterium]